MTKSLVEQAKEIWENNPHLHNEWASVEDFTEAFIHEQTGEHVVD